MAGKKKYSPEEDRMTQKLAKTLQGFREGYNGKIGKSGGMHVPTKNIERYK
jgi:hypothetical protein